MLFVLIWILEDEKWSDEVFITQKKYHEQKYGGGELSTYNRSVEDSKCLLAGSTG